MTIASTLRVCEWDAAANGVDDVELLAGWLAVCSGGRVSEGSWREGAGRIPEKEGRGGGPMGNWAWPDADIEPARCGSDSRRRCSCC